MPRKVTVKTKPENNKTDALSVPVYSLEGKEAGNLELPKEVFGASINKPLLTQAVRVYLNNLKAHWSNTKTRGEVTGSTRKIYRQKGTGHARHGANTAPLFVGGGIALGPKFHKVLLNLPKKMKAAALRSVLSSKALEGEIWGLSDLDKASGRTSQIKDFLNKMNQKSVLFVTSQKNEKITQAVRNLPKVAALSAGAVNVLDILKYRTIVLTKEAVEKFEQRVKGEAKEV